MKSRLLSGASAVAFCLALTLTACDSDQTLPTEPTVAGETGGNSPDFRVSPTDLTNPDVDSWTYQPEFDLGSLLSPSSLAAIGTLTPAELVDTLAAGETVTEAKTASLPAQADVVDILFAFDNTGSMGGELANLKVNAVDIMNSLAGLISDVQFGLVSFADYFGTFVNGGSGGCDYVAAYGNFGDDPYIVEQALNSDIETVAGSIGDLELSPGGGADFPESYSRALYELAQELLDNTGPDGPVNWRPDARRIVILFGDAIPHSCDIFNPVESAIGSDLLAFLEGAGLNDWGIDPGRDVVIGTADDLAILDVIEDLVDTDLTLISLHSTQFIITGTDIEPTQDLWDFYAEETGGVNFEINEDGSFPEGTNIVETILELVGDQITTVDELILDVCPGDESYADWISSVTPSSYADIDLPADRDFDLVIGPPSGTDPGVYAFGVCAIGDGAVLGSQSVTITVPGATEPAADLSIEKTADPTSVLVGEDITWTVTIANAGPDAATNVVFTDELPSGVSLVTDISSICTIDAGVATCEVGDLAAGEDLSIDIVTTADAAGSPVNSVEVSSDVADPNTDDNSSSAEVSVTEPPEPGECVVVDFENSGSHLEMVSSFALGEATVSISVEPGGARSQAAAAIYDTDTVDGPDPDLEWDGGTCAGCEGQGNVLMIADIAIATGGDSEDGGVIVLTGLPAGGYGLASLVAFDSDGRAFTVEVDGGEVGQTTPGADGNVQGLVLDANVITGEVRIDLDGDSGAVDDLEFCPAGN